MDAPPGVFKGSVDRFNGVTVDSHSEFDENEDFCKKLESKLMFVCNKLDKWIYYVLSFRIYTILEGTKTESYLVQCKN